MLPNSAPAGAEKLVKNSIIYHTFIYPAGYRFVKRQVIRKCMIYVGMDQVLMPEPNFFIELELFIETQQVMIWDTSIVSWTLAIASI